MTVFLMVAIVAVMWRRLEMGRPRSSPHRSCVECSAKLRTGTVEITPNMVLDEVTRLDRQAQSSDTFRQFAAVVLIYPAVGPCIHRDVKKVRGQVLHHIAQSGGSLPQDVHLKSLIKSRWRSC